MDVVTRLLGIDIGGTKTHGVLTEAGAVIAEAKVGSANLDTVGPATARRELAALLTRLGGCDGVTAVGVGSGGIDTPGEVAALRALLAEFLPQVPIRVVHDTEIVLAAGGLDDGIALIAGTGSSAWGRLGAATARAGGWGHLVADEGSGYWFGREAVRRVLRENDAGRSDSPLAVALLSACGLTAPADLIGHFHREPERRYWAARAHLVFEAAAAGDRTADAIIDDGAAELADLVRRVITRLGAPVPVVMSGGLATHFPTLSDRVRTLLKSDGVTELRVLEQDPVFGAVALAEQLSVHTDDERMRDG